MQDKFEILNFEDEVVSVENLQQIIVAYPMFKIGQFIAEVKNVLQNYGKGDPKPKEKWFDEGINCEILKFGAKTWQKGKVKIRISLEFCPDKPVFEEAATSNQSEATHSESPLDDLRQIITVNN